MAHALGIDVIAEGVESSTQLKILQGEGCKEFQGYFFARPKALADLELFIKKRQVKFADLPTEIPV